MTIAVSPVATPLADSLARALDAADPDALDNLAGTSPAGPRDRFETLLRIYDLHLAPLERVGAAARFQHHPAVSALKVRCENDWLAELEQLPLPRSVSRAMSADGPTTAMRALAARNRLPAVYKWLARQASWAEVVRFLALEGGPDAGFDDLVAGCQIGLAGAPKMELATNYWDEMGNGDPAAVHTTLHDRLVAAVDLPQIPLDEQPLSALERLAFGGLLGTNRWLQPEMLGALGLIELQAGPRCRLVLQALQRCGAPPAAYPFYEIHADVDPRHGRDWLENAIAPTVEDDPALGARIVRGALWRSAINDAFLDELGETFGLSAPAPADARTAAA